MLKALLVGCGLAVGTLLYSLFISGAGAYRLDWPRAVVIGALGFLVHWLYFSIKSKTSKDVA
jgi:hypothetical protein